MGMLGVNCPSFVELDLKARVNLVADNLSERLDIDVVGASDVQNLAVGAVVCEELLVVRPNVVAGEHRAVVGVERVEAKGCVLDRQD